MNIPLSVGALQKQIKQYVTACTGVDVYKIRVMVENDASIPVASTYEVQDVTPLPSAEETAEQPMVTPPAQPVARMTNVRCISACSARRSSPRLCPRRRK